MDTERFTADFTIAARFLSGALKGQGPRKGAGIPSVPKGSGKTGYRECRNDVPGLFFEGDGAALKNVSAARPAGAEIACRVRYSSTSRFAMESIQQVRILTDIPKTSFVFLSV